MEKEDKVQAEAQGRRMNTAKKIAIVVVACLLIVYLVKRNPTETSSTETDPSKVLVPDEAAATPLPDNVFAQYDFKKQGKVPKRTVPVAVVDEHHEVVPYWVGEIIDGNLHSQGNVLVHVDGHSDLAMPGKMAEVLSTALTKNVSRLKPFMQANDRFIVPFFLTGMYDSVLWVYPKFALPFNSTIYNEARGFGFTEKGSACLCTEMPVTPKTICMEIDDKMGYDMNDDYHFIPPATCLLEKKLRLKMIHENDLLSFMESGWLDEDKHMVLDIDEDFFGVGTDYARALTYFSRSDIVKMNGIISNTFCPQTTEHENYLDAHIRGILSDVQSFKRSKPGYTSTEDDALNTAKDFSIRKLERKGLKCKKRDRSGKKVFYLARLFHAFDIEQLDMLKKYRFCLSHSPIFGASKFGICLGMDINNQITHTRVPDSRTIKEKTEIITKLFGKLFKSTPGPQIVTICRSIRDSYTPRPKFREIENSLLLALKQSAFKESVSLAEKFDPNLLFGKDGWIDG